jgi:sugar lactone lactonase YvrE
LHPIRLRFADRTGSTHINIYWRPPGSELETIPMEALFPPQADKALLDPQNWNVLTNPITPGSAPVNPGKELDMPLIAARLLWRTGECGNGAGRFQTPHGITVDQGGNIWIADTGNQRIVELNPEGEFIRSFGRPGDGAGQFLQPFDLVVETDGNLVVLDSENPAVLQRFTHAGEFQAAIGASLGTYSARGLGIDAAGNLYVVDTGNARILRVSPAGDILQKWGKDETNLDLGQPVGVSTASDGSIFVVEAVQGLVWKISSTGKNSSWLAVAPSDTVDGPRISIGADDHIFITDPENRRVVVYTIDGQPIGQLRALDENAPLFVKPVGIAVTPDGVLVVSDSTLCQVLAFKLPESLHP